MLDTGDSDSATSAAGQSAHQRVRVSDLQPYPGNARRGDVDAIVESLTVLGQYRPIVVNRGTLTGRPYEVLAGNHTWQAAQRLGWDEIDGWLIDVDDPTARKINLVDNRSNDLARYDEDLLAAQLADLDGDLAGTGWDEAAIAKLIAEVPEPSADPAMGDLEFRVIVDCRDEDHQQALMAQLEAEGLTCRPLVS